MPSVIYQLFLTGPSRLVVAATALSSSVVFFARLFGFLYNSQTKIGLFFIVGRVLGDIDEDGSVDIADLTIVASNFGRDNTLTVMSQPDTAESYPMSCYVDTTGSGVINVIDIVVVASSFGTSY